MRTDLVVSSNPQMLQSKKFSSNNISINKSMNSNINITNNNSNSSPFLREKHGNFHHQKEKLQQQHANTSLNSSNSVDSLLLLKNNRSSSLPLKIVFNQGMKQHQQQQNNMAKSWNGDSSVFLHRQQKSNSFDRTRSSHCHNNSLFLPYKYAQQSMSEHFLNLIELEESKHYHQMQINNLIRYMSTTTTTTTEASSPHPITTSHDDDDTITKRCPNGDDVDHEMHLNNASMSSSCSSSNSDCQFLVDPHEKECPNSNETCTSNEDTTTTAPETDSTAQITNSPDELTLIENEKNSSNNTTVDNDHDNNEYEEAKDDSPAQKDVAPAVVLSLTESSQSTSSSCENLEPNMPSLLTEYGNTSTTTNTTTTNVDSSVIEIQTKLAATNVNTTDSSGIGSNITDSNSTCSNEEIPSDDFSANNESEDTNNNVNEKDNNNSLLTISEVSTLDENDACQDLEYASQTSSSDQDQDDELACVDNYFRPKKSCLARKSKFYIDTEACGENSSSIMDSANATSSPLIPTSPPSSPLSSLSLSSISTSSTKKRVSFADVYGKELFSVRTMSEPSNCPPKLTSKIVQYFLNREFSPTDASPMNPNLNRFNFPTNDLARNYDYGISASNYTNDVRQMSGSIAVYSLNFNQPASDYVKFRQKIEQNYVSLENVLLNRFQINGTIKVKNIHFHKQVFVRCSFNNWTSYQDYQAQFVPNDYYTVSSTFNSPTHSSSAVFYGTSTNIAYQSSHKEFDTFRFEFQLPKTVNNPCSLGIGSHVKNTLSSSSPSCNGAGSPPLTQKELAGSIQFCICYKSGAGEQTREFWDSNQSANYEILQYVIDIESLKPSNQMSNRPNKNYNNSSSPNTNTKTNNNNNNTLLLSQESAINGIYY
jgi:hypothetical protein